MNQIILGRLIDELRYATEVAISAKARDGQEADTWRANIEDLIASATETEEPTDNKLLASVLRKFIDSDEYVAWGGDHQKVKSFPYWITLDGSVVITEEEHAALNRIQTPAAQKDS